MTAPRRSNFRPDPRSSGLYLSYLVAQQIVMTVITEGPDTGAGRGFALIKNGPGGDAFPGETSKRRIRPAVAKKERLLLKTGDYFGWWHFTFPVVKANCRRAANRVKTEDAGWGFCGGKGGVFEGI